MPVYACGHCGEEAEPDLLTFRDGAIQAITEAVGVHCASCNRTTSAGIAVAVANGQRLEELLNALAENSH